MDSELEEPDEFDEEMDELDEEMDEYEEEDVDDTGQVGGEGR